MPLPCAHSLFLKLAAAPWDLHAVFLPCLGLPQAPCTSILLLFGTDHCTSSPMRERAGEKLSQKHCMHGGLAATCPGPHFVHGCILRQIPWQPPIREELWMRPPPHGAFDGTALLSVSLPTLPPPPPHRASFQQHPVAVCLRLMPHVSPYPSLTLFPDNIFIFSSTTFSIVYR